MLKSFAFRKSLGNSASIVILGTLISICLLLFIAFFTEITFFSDARLKLQPFLKEHQYESISVYPISSNENMKDINLEKTYYDVFHQNNKFASYIVAPLSMFELRVDDDMLNMNLQVLLGKFNELNENDNSDDIQFAVSNKQSHLLGREVQVNNVIYKINGIVTDENPLYHFNPYIDTDYRLYLYCRDINILKTLLSIDYRDIKYDHMYIRRPSEDDKLAIRTSFYKNANFFVGFQENTNLEDSTAEHQKQINISVIIFFNLLLFFIALIYNIWEEIHLEFNNLYLYHSFGAKQRDINIQILLLVLFYFFIPITSLIFVTLILYDLNIRYKILGFILMLIMIILVYLSMVLSFENYINNAKGGD